MIEPNWVEVMRAGRHIDGNGRAWDIDAKRLADVVAGYDPAYHEAPAVVGHPDTDSPAFGWVEKLKLESGRLFARFKQLAPEFVQAVRDGRYKKISVQLYPDLDGRGWYLKHVGFLGGAAPAVKGMAPVKFKEGDSVAFQSPIGGDEQMDQTALTAWFEEKFKPVLDFVKGGGSKPAPATEPPAVGSAAFNEALKAAVAEQVTPLTAQFNDQITALQTENAGLKQRLDSAAAQGTRATADGLIATAEREGRWVPAFNEDGTREMVYAMAESQAVEFGEAGTDGKRKSLDGIGQVKNYLAKLPQRVQFGELTADAGDNKASAKEVGFNAPTNGNVVVHNFGLAARANEIEAERKVSPAEALRLARMDATG